MLYPLVILIAFFIVFSLYASLASLIYSITLNSIFDAIHMITLKSVSVFSLVDHDLGFVELISQSYNNALFLREFFSVHSDSIFTVEETSGLVCSIHVIIARSYLNFSHVHLFCKEDTLLI